MINREGEKGPFYVFYDPAQNLFVDAPAIPDLGKPYELQTNCRNSKRIAATCSKIRGIEIRVRDEAPEGTHCEIKVASSGEAQQRLCEQYIREWVSKGKLTPNQVAILSPHGKPRSSLADVKAVGKVPITTDPQKWLADGAVLFATIRSFKGLEADAVIMVDIDVPGKVPYFTTADFYVGCSRAKHLLAILATDEGVL
jgi:hypothetical protein